MGPTASCFCDSQLEAQGTEPYTIHSSSGILEGFPAAKAATCNAPGTVFNE